MTELVTPDQWRAAVAVAVARVTEGLARGAGVPDAGVLAALYELCVAAELRHTARAIRDEQIAHGYASPPTLVRYERVE